MNGQGLGPSMSDGQGRSVVEGEVRALRQEVAELRAEQKALLAAMEEMTRTFRAIATHMGIAAEPYKRNGEPPREREIPGFG
jgi:hypothetical protein